MKTMTKRLLLCFAGAVLLGIFLHFLYGLLPNPLSALFSPVRESLWEHVKIVFWPLLAAGFLAAGRRAGPARAVWLLSAVLSSLAMLGTAYAYHILLGGEAMAFDLALYAAAMAAGFLLPRLLWPLGDSPAGRRLAWLAACALAALIVWFTFSPPEHVLFADLTYAVRTFLTIPV